MKEKVSTKIEVENLDERVRNLGIILDNLDEWKHFLLSTNQIVKKGNLSNLVKEFEEILKNRSLI